MLSVLYPHCIRILNLTPKLTQTCRHPAVKCADGSLGKCEVTIISVPGYSAGGLLKITNGLKVRKSTEPNSCPSGWKIWSPRNKNDWTLVYNALGKTMANYPQRRDLIVDVTRNDDDCGGCGNYAMNSGVKEQRGWKTSDGSAWWLRDSTYKEPTGDYKANCYLEVTLVNPDHVHVDDRNCDRYSTDYLCQPITRTYVGSLWSALVVSSNLQRSVETVFALTCMCNHAVP